ncbi:hypothetical protein TB1_038861 [Malus domestica]|uniref:D-cysteine desulfhydrase 1, mitochondrial-like isoform X1 n=1 Tax=Malus domestica TaxID=3750 RepID=UPI003975E798
MRPHFTSYYVLVDQDPGLTGNLLVERLVTTSEEINFVKEIAATTGIVLDPVYSGKAAYGMMIDMAENPIGKEERFSSCTQAGYLGWTTR